MVHSNLYSQVRDPGKEKMIEVTIQFMGILVMATGIIHNLSGE